MDNLMNIEKNKHFLEEAFKAAFSFQPFKSEKTDQNETVQMIETKIYIGLNDADTKEQIFETQQYRDVLKDVCRNYHVAFSVHEEEGGYCHEDGQYTEETSLVLTLINPEKTLVEQIAQDLCVFFHQESVLITEDTVKGYFIYEKVLTEGE